METFKLKRSDWIIVILLLFLIICFIVWQPNSKPVTEKESRLSKFAKRLQQLSDKLEDELTELHLTKE